MTIVLLVLRSACVLGHLSVEEFMALPSSEEDDDPAAVLETSRKRKRKREAETKLKSEEKEFLEEEDLQWMVENEAEWTSEEEELGEVEPRPPHVTNWKEKVSLNLILGSPPGKPYRSMHTHSLPGSQDGLSW